MATNLQFIKSASGSSVSSLSITGFTTEYDVYAIWTPTLVQDGNNDIEARFVDSGGNIITASEYSYACLSMNAGGAFSDVKSTSSDRIENVGVNDQNETFGVGSTTYIYNPADSSSFTFLTHQSSGMRDNGQLRGYKTSAVHKVAEEITGYNIFGLSGDITATMILYGVK